MADTDPGITDGRLLRGERTRRLVLRAAVDAASLDGLEGVTFGRLSTTTGQTKAGIQTLFRTKENLQVATARFAATLFTEAVIAPAEQHRPGLDRLGALVDRWLAYASEPLFAGGCFWSATAAEFDSREGSVRDLLREQRDGWRRAIEREVSAAVDAREIGPSRSAVVAFAIDAVLQSTNTELRLGNDTILGDARAAIDALLGR